MMVRIRRHYVPLQVVILAAVDFLILFLSMYVGIELRLPDVDIVSPQGIVSAAPRSITYVVAMFTVMIAVGLYERDVLQDTWIYYVRLAMAFVLGLLAMTFVFYLLPDLFLGRGAFALTMLASALGIVSARELCLRIVSREILRSRVLVLGTGSRAALIEKLRRNHGGRRKFDIVGYVPIGSNSHAVPAEKIIQPQTSLVDLALRLRVAEIVIAVRDRRGGKLPIRELLECKIEGIGVIDLASFFERETGRVQLDSFNMSWMVFSDGFCCTSLHRWVKRIVDVAASATMLTASFPILVLTALAVMIESGRPILYRQVRIGERGALFEVLKFRSMRVDAEQSGVPQWAQRNDSRVTRVGSVIRLLRFDELPQLFNVLRGDMSFVGPRPERPFFVKQLEQEIPYYANRHKIKPGITGWAQIRYPYGASVTDAREKLQYDLYYAKNHSLFLDLLIMLQTAHVVIFGKGAR